MHLDALGVGLRVGVRVREWGGDERGEHVRAVARPWRMENDDTEAVMEARLRRQWYRIWLASSAWSKGLSTHDEAARSVVPRWPIETTDAKTRDHSAIWVKNTGMDDRVMIATSAWPGQRKSFDT
jgi:hypothetical protein